MDNGCAKFLFFISEFISGSYYLSLYTNVLIMPPCIFYLISLVEASVECLQICLLSFCTVAYQNSGRWLHKEPVRYFMYRMIHSLHLFPLYTDTVWFNKCTSVKNKILLAPPLWSSNAKTEKKKITRTVNANVLTVWKEAEMKAGALLLSLNYKKTKLNKFFHLRGLKSFRYLFRFGSMVWWTSGCTLRWRRARCWTTPVMSPRSPRTSRWPWRERDLQRSQLTWTSSENTTSSTTRTSFTLQPRTPSHSMTQQHLFTSVALLVRKSWCRQDKQHHLVDAGVLRDDLSGSPVWWAVPNWFLMWTPRLKESSWKRRYCFLVWKKENAQNEQTHGLSGGKRGNARLPRIAALFTGLLWDI